MDSDYSSYRYIFTFRTFATVSDSPLSPKQFHKTDITDNESVKKTLMNIDWSKPVSSGNLRTKARLDRSLSGKR